MAVVSTPDGIDLAITFAVPMRSSDLRDLVAFCEEKGLDINEWARSVLMDEAHR